MNEMPVMLQNKIGKWVVGNSVCNTECHLKYFLKTMYLVNKKKISQTFLKSYRILIGWLSYTTDRRSQVYVHWLINLGILLTIYCTADAICANIGLASNSE